MDEVTFELFFRYLSRSRVKEDVLRKVIIPHLVEQGFTQVGDLQDLEVKYLDHKDLDISPLDRNRIMKLVAHSEPEVFSQVNMSAQTQTNDFVSLRYIWCQDLFSTDISECNIDDKKPTVSLKDIVSIIHKEAQLSADKEAIELYSSEGYPLHNNELTSKESLKRWGINDGDLFFAIIRPKEQPGQLQFATLPKVDHDIGEETFTIETPFLEKFTVNAYIDTDSPEDIAQKIYSITDIPVPYMSLYVRNRCTYERLNTFTELNDTDTIHVVLRNPQEVATPRSPHYGIHSYNPLVNQTKEGMSKFYSILKFICSLQPYNKEYDFEKLSSYILTITEFPPLVHALCTLRDRSYLTIAGWTALIEGCYFLFKAILNDQTNVSVNDSKVFEYSDYIWGLLIRMSKGVNDVTKVEYDTVSLTCPLSEKRISSPVRISANSDLGPFDKTNCLSQLNTPGGGFRNYGIGYQLTDNDIVDDEDTHRYLMYYPWESDDKILTWKNPPTPTIPASCKKIAFQTNPYQMVECLKELCIVHPHGLYAGAECLTFIQQGRLVYFLGAAKGTDETRKVYDPLEVDGEYTKPLSKEELSSIGYDSLEELVSHNLSNNVALNTSEETTLFTENRISAIITPQKSIQWEPEEAIVVLLDRSWSMDDPVYSELQHLRRIDAAKELFNAFATRTQAYKLHHAFGLIVFESSPSLRLQVTKNVEDFEDSLKGIEPDGGTDIPSAIISAVDQLARYSCIRRILCLTDGECSSSYAQAFQNIQGYNVVVDTILLSMTPDISNTLKTFSHASGGVCVCPQSMQEALTFFELDSFLSLRERSTTPHPQDMSSCSYTPFETKDSFRSKHFTSFHTIQTLSVKQYIDRDRSVYQVNIASKHRRIIKELRDFLHSPHEDIRVYPCEHDYAKWKVLMRGPPATHYDGGVFILSMEFPEKYPTVPPSVRFLTPIYHCNVSTSSGRICHSILGEAYTPATSVKDLLCHIYGLLMSPDMDSPLDSTLADEFGYLSHQETDLDIPLDHTRFFGAADKYFYTARQHVLAYAVSKTFEQLDRELSS